MFTSRRVEFVVLITSDLHNLIADVLQQMTHARLSEAPQQIAGLVVPNGEGLSKRQRIELALENLTQEALARLALKFAAHRGDIALDEVGARCSKPATRR